MNTIKLGIIGMGTVATGVVGGLAKNKELIKSRKKLEFEIVCIAVRNLKSKRNIELSQEVFTNNPEEVVNHKDVNIVVELMGGVKPTYDYVCKALKNKKSVVTANKALISTYGPELFNLARENSVGLFFEASVAGGIPIIKALQSSLSANDIDNIQGILNGTCNYILSQMDAGNNFQEALKDAQKKGYAEADPTLDIDGTDTIQKAGILASLIYGQWFSTKQLDKQGIQDISTQDIEFARSLGYKIKLIANIQKTQDKKVCITVKPTLVACNALLSSVNDVFNAVKVQGNMIGESLFYGHGAGKDATASSVCADILEAAESLIDHTLAKHPNFVKYKGCEGLGKSDNLQSRYYIRLVVKNHSNNILSNITHQLGQQDISIASIHQEESSEFLIPIIILTHLCSTQQLKKALKNIQQEGLIEEELVVYPVIN